MAKGKGKAAEPVEPLREDPTTHSERSGDDNRPNSPSQEENFATPTTGDFGRQPEPPMSSASTWGYRTGDQHEMPTTPSKPPTFGTAYPTEGLSPLPQQVRQPTTEQSIPIPEAGPSRLPDPVKATLPRLTRGSASKTITFLIDGGEETRYIEQVSVLPLQNIEGPLTGLSRNKMHYTNVYIEFFGTKSLQEMVSDPVLGIAMTDRWVEALRLGQTYLKRDYNLPAHSMNHNQISPTDRIMLKTILDDLDSLLTQVDKYSDRKCKGFKVDKDRLFALSAKLLKIREETKEGLKLSGDGIPDVPNWGLDGNANRYWRANDFEILGACYREEVTQFCIRVMSAYHNVRPKIFEDIEGPILPPQETFPPQQTPRTERTPVNRPEERQQLFDDAPISTASRIHSFTNKNAAIFGNPSRNTASQKLNEVLTARPRFTRSAPDPNDPDGDGDDGDGGRRPPRRDGPRHNGRGGSRRGGQGRPPSRNGRPPSPPDEGDPSGDPSGGGGSNRSSNRPTIPQFDSKLKVDIIPSWDGNTDDLGRWLIKINRLSERSEIIYQQLGYLVPTKLTGAAELWYYSQSAEVRSRIEEDWGTLKNAIAGYYMNRSYLERQRVRANKARYRQFGCTNETPSEYFIRKLELLEIVYNYSEGELINEIMAGAPTYWSTILAPHLYDSIEGFQMAVKFQEDNLLRIGLEATRQRQENFVPTRNSRNPFSKYSGNNQNIAKVNAVGWSKATTNPAFPKDDSNVSPRGTPEEKGGRPCRHCGSGKHWDPECKYSRKGERRARVNAVEATPEDRKAEEDYDDLYYSLETDDDEEIGEEDFQ